jgi:outer membrane protein OmpA-like peptidoglycan-associated protein
LSTAGLTKCERLPVVAITALLLCMALPFSAHAYDLRTFRQSPHTGAYLSVDPAFVPDTLTLQLALSADGTYLPLVLVDRDANAVVGPLVQHRIDMTASASLALFGRLSLAAWFPLTVFQQGTGLDSVSALQLAPGDLNFEAKLEILTSEREGVDLGVLAHLGVPVGNATQLTGDGFVSAGGDVLIGRHFGPVGWHSSLGAAFRRQQTLYELQLGSELRAKTALALHLEHWLPAVRLQIILEAFARTPLLAPFQGEGATPFEAVLGLRFMATEWLTLSTGIGRGILPGLGAPAVRWFLSLSFIPFGGQPQRAARTTQSLPAPSSTAAVVNADKDNDGLIGASDLCPDEAEDLDGFADGDGCPEIDADRDGVADQNDRCPMQAEDHDGVDDGDGCPEVDADDDGVADKVDRCPMQAEDRDGVEDGDGCPDVDNDHDGIADATDKCPNEAETINNNADDDGCPDKGETLVAVETTQISIKEKVFFKTDQTTVAPRSYPLLIQVARVLLNRSDIKMLRIEGHTDKIGTTEYNKALSLKRAQSVLKVLVEVGKLDAARLSAVGYGETRPLASNAKAKGRAANRRVVFTIIDQAGAASAPIDPLK